MGAQGAKNIESGNEWATPEEVVMDAARALGIDHFDLDPAATESNAQAVAFYDRESNGLEKEWFGHVWLNPPFSRSIKKCTFPCKREGCKKRGNHLEQDQHGAIDFARKAAKELESGRVESIAWHGPVAPDTDWYGILWFFARVRYDYTERIAYNGEKSGGTFPSMTMILRPGQCPTEAVPTYRVQPGGLVEPEPCKTLECICDPHKVLWECPVHGTRTTLEDSNV